MDFGYHQREDYYPSRNSPSPQWIARREPAVHSCWTRHSPLAREQHEAFSRDGFLVVDNLFWPNEVAALESELARLRRDPSRLLSATVIAEPGSDDIRSIFAIHKQSPMFRRLARDERLLDIARYILGDDVYIHQSRLNYKPGFTGKEFYWHSDFETWHVEDGMPAMRAVSVSILLSENVSVNGPLMLIPGSHNHFISCVGETPEDHYRSSLKKQEYGVPDPASLTSLFAAHGVSAPTGPAGTVIFFDCNTMHGSNSNITPLPRSNAFLVYNAVSNSLQEPFGAPSPRPEFVAARKNIRPLKPLPGPVWPGAAP